MNKDRTDYEDELFYSFIEHEEQPTNNKLTLPAIVDKYTLDAVKASNYNEVPSALTFFVLLGQLVKDINSYGCKLLEQVNQP